MCPEAKVWRSVVRLVVSQREKVCVHMNIFTQLMFAIWKLTPSGVQQNVVEQLGAYAGAAGMRRDQHRGIERTSPTS